MIVCYIHFCYDNVKYCYVSFGVLRMWFCQEIFIIETGILWHWSTIHYGQKSRNELHLLSWFINHRRMPEKSDSKFWCLNHTSDSTQQLSTKTEHLNNTSRIEESTNYHSIIIPNPIPVQKRQSQADLRKLTENIHKLISN